MKQEVIFDTVICTYDLTFNNEAYTKYIEGAQERKEASLPVRASVIFEMFPFCILFQVRYFLLRELHLTPQGHCAFLKE